MGGKVGEDSFFWVAEYNEEHNEQLGPPPLISLKRKARSKKWEFVGWGSRPLIEFLHSIGKDTSQEISRFDVSDIINKYVNENSLLHSVKKKRIVCDERLYSLFGKRSISRIKIYELLEDHYAENHFESDDDLLYSSEEENNFTSCEKQKIRKTPLKKQHLEASKSCFAAISPDNIKLVYLKRSLVQDLLKDPETFEHKVVGSFVRIKSDPNDYLQKNSHQLLQVTGIKRVSRTVDTSAEILLQVSNFVKDIQISALSDDHFSVEECEDLRQKVKDGLLKRPTIVELEEKALILHEDVTKHRLVRELALLQKLIDRANEKGWRRELFEYLERRQLLQTPSEQDRLLHEVPKIIADEEEVEATPQDCLDTLGKGKDDDEGETEATTQDCLDTMEKGKDDSLVPILRGASKIPICTIAANDTIPSLVYLSSESVGIHAASLKSEQLTKIENGPDTCVPKGLEQPTEIRSENTAILHVLEIEDNKLTEGLANTVVIDLSDDDEENENPSGGNQMLDTDQRSLEWHYTDPEGNIQGPFSIASLKRWWDAEYFPADFKVWKWGESRDKAVLLHDILQQSFPN